MPQEKGHGASQFWVDDQGSQAFSLLDLSLVSFPTSVSLTRNEVSTHFWGI